MEGVRHALQKQKTVISPVFEAFAVLAEEVRSTSSNLVRGEYTSSEHLSKMKMAIGGVDVAANKPLDRVKRVPFWGGRPLERLVDGRFRFIDGRLVRRPVESVDRGQVGLDLTNRDEDVRLPRSYPARPPGHVAFVGLAAR